MDRSSGPSWKPINRIYLKLIWIHINLSSPLPFGLGSHRSDEGSSVKGLKLQDEAHTKLGFSDSKSLA